MVARPLPDIAGTYFGRVIGNSGGHPSTNIFTWQTLTPPATGPADLAVANDVAVAMSSSWIAHMIPQYPSVYESTEFQVYALHTPLAPAVSVFATNPGGNPLSAAPMAVGALIHHTVFRRGKGSQSRTTMSPIPEGAVAGDLRSLTGGAQAAIQTAFDGFIAAVQAEVLAADGHVLNYVQLSRGTTHIAPQTFDVTLSSVEPLLTTQRRRVQR